MYAAIAVACEWNWQRSTYCSGRQTGISSLHSFWFKSGFSNSRKSGLWKTKDTFEKYLDRMSKEGTWGDGNILSESSLCYKRRLQQHDVQNSRAKKTDYRSSLKGLRRPLGAWAPQAEA